MIPHPSFLFFIPGEDGHISPDHDLWYLPLSGNSSGFLNTQNTEPSSGEGLTSGLTIGEYFTAARIFLENDHLLDRALSSMEGRGKKNNPIQRVELFLEKHGAFYHPIRVKVLSETCGSVCFVLNGAVSRPGLSLIEREYHLLASLEHQVSIAYTPRVFAVGVQTVGIQTSGIQIPEKTTPKNIDSKSNLESRDVRFFLGEWFEGFREFHISNRDGERQIAVWASNGEIEYLSLEGAAVIYEQIAYILTAYYNVDTGEQISPWHHAAGDFIVNPLAEGFPVRLITVRGYESLMEYDSDGAPTSEQVLPSLLFFFLNLTLRTQMDRLDGVGKLVFLGEAALKAVITGFLRGLDDKTAYSGAPAPGGSGAGVGLRMVFVRFMKGFSLEQVAAVLASLIESWPENAAEVILATDHLESHASSIHSLFKNI